MAIDYNAMGLRIREIRLNKKLTQEQISEKMGVSIAFLSRVERGSAHINLSRLSELCSILEVSEGEVLNVISPARPYYLNREFHRLLKDCPKEKLKLLYKVAKVIIEDNDRPRERTKITITENKRGRKKKNK